MEVEGSNHPNISIQMEKILKMLIGCVPDVLIKNHENENRARVKKKKYCCYRVGYNSHV